MQGADASGVEVWALALEEVRQVGFQVVLVGELLPSHGTVEGGEKVVVGWR